MRTRSKGVTVLGKKEQPVVANEEQTERDNTGYSVQGENTERQGVESNEEQTPDRGRDSDTEEEDSPVEVTPEQRRDLIKKWAQTIESPRSLKGERGEKSLLEENKSLKNELGQTKRELLTMGKDKEILAQYVKKLEKELKDCNEKETTKERKELVKLQKENMLHLTKKADKAEKERKEAEDSVKKLNSELMKVNQAHDVALKHQESWRKKVSELQSKLNSINMINTRKNDDEHVHCKNKIQEKEGEIVKLKEQISSYDTRNRNLLTDIMSKERTNLQLCDYLETVKEINKKLEMSLATTSNDKLPKGNQAEIVMEDTPGLEIGREVEVATQNAVGSPNSLIGERTTTVGNRPESAHDRPDTITSPISSTSRTVPATETIKGIPPRIEKEKVNRQCRYFQNGKCVKGDECRFQHVNSPPKTCRFFERGYCKFGNDCKFHHETGKKANNVCVFYQRGHCKLENKCRFSHQISKKSNNDHRYMNKSDNEYEEDWSKNQNGLKSGIASQLQEAIYKALKQFEI